MPDKISYEEAADLMCWIAERYMAEPTHSYEQWQDCDTRLRYAFYLVGWTAEEFDEELERRLDEQIQEANRAQFNS